MLRADRAPDVCQHIPVAPIWTSLDALLVEGVRSKDRLGIKLDIVAAQQAAEWVRYVNSLLDRGIYDELEQMADRLYRIALDRYAR